MTAVRNDAQTALRVVRARDELVNRERLRAVVDAAANGLSQRAIAESLGVSQPAVAKMLVRARRYPGAWQRTPRHVALQYAAGELSRAQMRKAFTDWQWTVGHLDGPGSEWAEGWVAGSWDELVGAVTDGLISDEDYAFVFERTREP